jgi:hypothetical protein
MGKISGAVLTRPTGPFPESAKYKNGFEQRLQDEDIAQESECSVTCSMKNKGTQMVWDKNLQTM